ncbi:MAG TPA: 3'(2'),5'-bisphosphate nucleotidase CysQ [Longimicrobiales bacterium]
MLARELRVAARLARMGGLAAVRYYGSVTADYKDGGSPVTAADHAANRIIVQGLREAFPDDAILSEESRDSDERLDAERVWIVDPLDGTKEFLAQNGEFAIMIGLAVRGVAVLGAVYLPDGDTLYGAAPGIGAFVERKGTRAPLRRDPAGTGPLRLVGSRSHADPRLTAIQEALGITDVLPCGSVGVKCARILDGLRDLYIHPVPYLKEWDTCAPEAILREAGGSVTDCLGEPLRYNKPDPVQPHGIIACAPGVLTLVLEAVRRVYTAQ